MKTTVIPAQITTVEDTISGNLTLTQIVLLIAPVMASTAIYSVLPQKMSFTTYKIPIILLVTLVFVLLSLRIKGRLVLHWLTILTAYLLRPHLYVFNKNTLFSRSVILPPVQRKKVVPANVQVVINSKDEDTNQGFDYESLLRETDLNVRFTKKGLLMVKNI